MKGSRTELIQYIVPSYVFILVDELNSYMWLIVSSEF
jgi:hypothetical protein